MRMASGAVPGARRRRQTYQAMTPETEAAASSGSSNGVYCSVMRLPLGWAAERLRGSGGGREQARPVLVASSAPARRLSSAQRDSSTKDAERIHHRDHGERRRAESVNRRGRRGRRGRRERGGRGGCGGCGGCAAEMVQKGRAGESAAGGGEPGRYFVT